jgi:hypothetical protein
MIKTRTISIIDVSDWDKLVQTTYNKPYSFQQQEGCQERQLVDITVPDGELEDWDFENDTIPEVINGDEMGVSFKAWLARDPKEWNGDEQDRSFIDLFWHRNFYPNVQVLANDLYKRNLIPAGEYSIHIDW